MRKTGVPALILLLITLGTLFFLYASANRSQAQLAIDNEEITKFSANLEMWSQLMLGVGPREPSEVFEPAAKESLQAILRSPSVLALESLGLVADGAIERLKSDLAKPSQFTRIGEDFAVLKDSYRGFVEQQARTYRLLELGFYIAIAGLAALVVFWLLDERRRRARYEELQAVYRQSLVTLEEERHRIALGLHDTVAQELVALKFQLARAGGEEGTKTAMNQSLERAQSTLREIARGLRPPAIAQVGLIAALGELCQEFSRTSGLTLIRELDASSSRGPNAEYEIHIYRIVQESLNNAWKHAQCTEVKVASWCEDNWFKVRVRDNGAGLGASDTVRPGMGMTGMQERTGLMGARLSMSSSPENGTEVLLEVPL